MVNPALELPQDKIADFCRRRNVRRLSLFGSAIRGNFRPDSDVDVLVEFAKGTDVSLFEMISMETELEGILGRNVDLVSRDAVEQSRNYIRRKHILTDMEPIYVAR